MNPIILILVYVFIVLLPLGLAWFGVSDPRPTWDELASGAGMLAFAIILVEFVLSGRFRSVSRQLGMDVTMRFHQLIARTALVLALIHPFLYGTGFNLQRPWDVTRQLTLTPDLASLGTGIVAWILLTPFVLLSISRDKLPYKYETWRLMHGLGALLIAALVLHHALAAGRYSQDPILASVWVVLFAVAVISVIYVYLVEPLLQQQKAWVVQSVRPIGLKTWEISLDPVGHDGLSYEAGQFAWINVGNSSFSLYENPFSISSAPASGHRLQFMIKELGDFTKTIDQIKPGTRAYVDGPHGNLVVSGRQEPGIALIAGGVGIAPLMSILRQLSLEKDQRPTTLIYGNRIADQITYKNELATYQCGQKTNLLLALSDPPDDWTGHAGMIDRELIINTFKAEHMKDWLFVLCGPSRMMETVESALIEIGVHPRQIISERFDYD